MEPMNFAFLKNGPGRANGRSVAIIGAGPTGLAAAGYLACLGYRVEVFDKLPKAGGLMVFGIPEERLPAGRIDNAVALLRDRYGVRFRMATKVCGDEALCQDAGDDQAITLKSLGGRIAEHDAVMLCTGAWRANRLNIQGDDLPGVVPALSLLLARRLCSQSVEESLDLTISGRRVVVVGAGHSAVDAANTAQRMGASNVTMTYRRGLKEAPCGMAAIEDLVRNGVVVLEHLHPLRILGCDRVEQVEFVERGNKASWLLPVDVLVVAIGDKPNVPFEQTLNVTGLRREHDGKPALASTMTALEGVFVAGDALTGPTKIGRAVYSGLCVARILDRWLTSRTYAQAAQPSGGQA
ncbi:FAD-dependent oxidoreductase [Fundidesulfovibrio putealis]|uniref:FAD-dependent oxidoreductase n=1 Tax=Fundidesulfovibrio putealis TaxID=270496 RepID=UPI000425078B|nr:FAD-dependent oxidoreductase [Fundidesulfovibrio putealis]